MTIGRKFGQHEPLTTRLHNLVRSYPKGLGVFKEFIQNADDAEADEIVFVLDEQQYDVSGLPDSMQWLHTTPALLVYNNRPFSERDIQGIQNIGASGKSNSVGKTGRFGLGFNACYNVTDVPCFFTRGELHFFDPHFHTVPGASVESPGRSFAREELVAEGWPLLDALCQFVPDAKEFNGTLFRLPFRTHEQANSSRITKDAYTVIDALEAVRELQEVGSAILLFLKHVRHLKVEHRKLDGRVLGLLSMQTTNVTEVVESRVEVNTLLRSPDPESIMTTLCERGSVYSSCRHEYSVAANGKDRTETWRVVDGFFTDVHHNVVNTCRQMIENEEKALPYAGAAWPLDTDRRPAGRIFCFLPVPMQTRLPAQINGYFDLDDSRQNMFLDDSAHGAARLRVDWNRALLQTSVTQAYVRLLEDLRSDLGAGEWDSYYEAFPVAVADANEGSWEGWLTAAFYEHAAERPLFRVSGDTPWCALSTTRSVPTELLSVRDALIAEKFLPIPNPSLPPHVQDGFTTNGIAVPDLTPCDLRILLKEQNDVDCPVNVAPRACLRKREDVAQIFRFCLSDSPGQDIRGLPLAIDCRGYLRTVGLTAAPLYLAELPFDHEVFADHPEWFVDLDLARDLDLAATRGVGLLSMDSKCFVRELAKYVSAQVDDDGTWRMSTGRAGALTDAWLRAVFSRLMESDFRDVELVVGEIPLVPDQCRVLHPLGHSSTPLLFQGTQELQRALTDLSVPLVTGVSDKLFSILLQFSKKKRKIWPVTPRDLVDTLADVCSKVLQGYERITELQQALLGYLSRDESLAALEKIPDRRDKLKKLRLFPTANGLLVDLSETAYVPQDFTFPAVHFSVVLLDDGPSHRWRGLYVLLGAPELSRSRLIREALLPVFKHLDASARIEASSWLRDNLSLAQSEHTTDDSDGLFSHVRNAPIVVCEDGELRAPTSVYQPNSTLATAVLGEQATFPDMRITYAHDRERWLEFFRQLDMPVEPRMADVVEYVRSLTEDALISDKTERFQAVYDFVKGRVDAELQTPKVISSELAAALKELAGLPWLPLRQEAGEFLCFTPPGKACAPPCEVYFPRVGQLAASQAFITVLRPEPDKLARKAMGFPVTTPVELVVAHFKQVLNTCSTPQGMPKETTLVRALGQIYRFFGGEAPRETDELDLADDHRDSETTVDLKSRFSDVPCIWDQERTRFWRPDHVFTDDVRYMDPWRRTLRSGEAAIERGYAALGRRQDPTLEDWKQVLEEVSESGKSLSEHEVSEVVREVVRHIVEELLDGEATDGDVLVPTRSGRMLPAATVFMADAPWYDSMLDSWELPILSPSVSGIRGIQRVLKISSLDASIEQRLIEYPAESDLEDECRACSCLERLLRSDELILGLQRLLRHEGHEVSEDSLSYLRRVHVRCVKAIRTCLYLQSDGTERLLGDAEADIYWDHEALQAMLAENRPRYFWDDLAGLLNRALGNQSLQNLAPLVHVLRCEATEISSVLDDLKIRKYAFDHEERPAEDGEVVPQEFPDDATGATEQNEPGASEECQPRQSEDDASAKDDQPDDEESTPPIGNSGQGRHLTRPRDGSTATRPRPTTTAQSVERSIGGRPDVGSGRRTPSGTGTNESGRSATGRSDMERGEPSRGSGGEPRQSTGSRRQPSAQRRLVSYVSHGTRDSDRKDASSVGDGRRLRIAETAVQVVIEHETKNGREARPMAHPNPGYDVVSEREGERRYIEVKGTEAAWGERGVALTPTQFFYAREHQDRDYWLYVVEDVFSQTPRIHEIHRPSEKVDRFVFDGGWRQVAESAEGTGVRMPIPSPGDEVLWEGKVVGLVESILASGRFPLVLYRDLDGNQQRKLLADIVVRRKES